MALEPRLGLEFLTAYTAGFIVHVRTEDLVLRKILVGLEVLVAHVTVVMVIIMLLVPLHIFLGQKLQAAVSVRALDSRLVDWSRHFDFSKLFVIVWESD